MSEHEDMVGDQLADPMYDEPSGYWCRECAEPTYVGPPDDLCVGCDGFDWLGELQRSRAS